MTQVQRYLVKMRPPTTGITLTLDGSPIPFTVTPLLPALVQAGLAAGTEPQWHIIEPTTAIDAGNPWDFCHQLVSQGLGIAGDPPPQFAEPDFAQQWVSKAPDDALLALTTACQVTEQKTGPEGYPGNPDKFWYQDDAHSQFGQALATFPVPALYDCLRVAHLDTGYDPTHQTLPVNLELTLQRNFVDRGRPNDASDDTSGPLNNLGHGTGTLSILAGKPLPGMERLGAAAFAKVVPIRVSNRVELFYTSAVASGFNYVLELCNSSQTAVHALSMSMGGLASQAWAEAVNALYERGVVVVTAAGNNFGNVPTRHIVFPARFNRVIAACGVMADDSPYADLPITKMAGNYGPDSKMLTAVSAYTPNVPWAKYGCASIVDFDGAGTSAATPQVTAAAVLWMQKNKSACENYPNPWMRVESVRNALFTSAHNINTEKLGRGELKVANALAVNPAAEADLHKEPEDSASFGFLRVLTGLGVDAQVSAQQKMLELEALQLSQSASVEQLLPDPNVDPRTLPPAQRMAILTALATHPNASRTLRAALSAPQSVVPALSDVPDSVQAMRLRQALSPSHPVPPSRRLRIYAYDPQLNRELETFNLQETIANVRWENELGPGPAGEYVEVIDVDPTSGCCYAPLDLDDHRLLATDGLRPSEANPQFHQQMAYAVAMKTIEHFERALGRSALWAPNLVKGSATATATPPASGANAPANVTEQYVQRLRIYPHALRAENAYYSPERKALLLGYFASAPADANAPREFVFTALSHDIVAHETTHALLDGLHRRFREATNPDGLAFHEAFADIVALFQHFTLKASLRDQIADSRGDLSQDTLLAKLAVQFGISTGHYRSLRDAIGEEVVDSVTQSKIWRRKPANRNDYLASTEPHTHGSVLVAAVFDGFLQIYTRRAKEPIRLATNGSEVLPPGAISAELADALTAIASKVAGHILNICIRAVDYCPPIDITFGDFLRAAITADRDLVPDDDLGYRVALVSAFGARGIYPESVRNLSVNTLVWEPPPAPFPTIKKLLPKLDLHWDSQTGRRQAWLASRANAVIFHEWLMDPAKVSDDQISILGMHRHAQTGYSLKDSAGNVILCDMKGIEVHSVRPLRRVGPDGQLLSQVVVELTQALHATDGSGLVFRGGATLIIDLTKSAVSYMVRKRINQPARVTRQQAAMDQQLQQSDNTYAGNAAAKAEPFALLHRST